MRLIAGAKRLISGPKTHALNAPSGASTIGREVSPRDIDVRLAAELASICKLAKSRLAPALTPPLRSIMTSVTKIGAAIVTSWKVAEAKARLSELIDKAISEGAQEITRHGKRTVVVVSTEEWDRRTNRKGSLVEFFQNSPLKGSGIDLERMRDLPPDIKL
jgi:prevent-host-death family protein